MISLALRIFFLAVIGLFSLNLIPSTLAEPAPETKKDSSAEPEWLSGRHLDPTWTGGIGYLVEKRCLSCHQDGGEAPITFQNYAETQNWGKTIRINVSTGTMPPQEALSAREIDLFERWAGAGFPRGDGNYRMAGGVSPAVADTAKGDEHKTSTASHSVKLVQYRKVHEEINGSADSAVSRDGKWFAFASRRSGNLDIWIVGSEMGELRRITRNPAPEYEARWHPDGTKLTYVSERNGNQDVYMMDIQSGRETAISTASYNEDYPSFSKDGQMIVHTGGIFGEKEVWVHALESGKKWQVSSGFGYVGSSSFSPDGEQIVFHSYFDGSHSHTSDVYVVPTRGGEAVNITNTPKDWDYKANWGSGNWIALSSKIAGHDRAVAHQGGRSPYFNIFVMRPDGSDMQRITDVTGMDLRWPNWTGDGRLGWHGVSPQQGRLRSIEVQTGKITDILIEEDYVSDVGAFGDHIVFESRGDIYLLKRKAGAEPQLLTEGLQPRWSKDGKEISFLRYDEGKGGIGKISVEDGELLAMAWIEPVSVSDTPEPWDASQFTQAWSPDDKTLARVSSRDQGKALELVDQDGQARVLTSDGAVKSSPVWSTDGRHLFFVENRPRMVSYYLTTEKVIRP